MDAAAVSWPFCSGNDQTPALATASTGVFVRPALLCLVACFLAFGAQAQPFQIEQADDRQAAAIRHACGVGALTGPQCAAQGAAPAPAPPATEGQTWANQAAGRTGGRAFSDPQGRYRFDVPEGWELKMQGDTPGLTQGEAWIQVVATSAPSPQAAAHGVGTQFQPAFKQIQLVNQGAAQFGGHQGFGINAGGVSAAKGRKMSILVLAISAGGGHNLVLVSATPVEQAQALDAGVMAMANSIHFQGE